MESASPGPGSPLKRVVAALGQGAAALLGIVLLAGAGGILLATQTAAGRAAATGLLEDVLEGAVDGEVQVGAVTGGNLFTRVRMEGLEIRDADGETFVELEDVRAEYDPLRFLTGSYVLRRLTTGWLEVRLVQDGDGPWNFERIFARDGGEDDDDGGIRLRATDVTVEDGRLEVRTPWTGDPADEVWNLERTGRGLERVIELEGMSGRLPLVRLADPRRPMRVEMEGVVAVVRAVSRPVGLTGVDGAVTFSDTVRVRLDRVRSREGTSVSGSGRVAPTDPPRYRFDLEADRLAFADLLWLPVPVPSEGRGSGGLVLRSSDVDPDVAAVEVRDGDFRAGDSRVTGDLAVRLEETPVFEGVDLRLRPLRLGLVHELTETDGPDGRVEGYVRGDGPADLFEIDADVAMTADDGDPSRVRALGGIGLVGEPRRFDGLRLELGDVEPRWSRLVGVDARQEGRVDGVAGLDRSEEGRVAFSADLVHRVPGDSTSRVEGEGELDPEGESMEVDLDADPLSLAVLDPFFPTLDLVGVVRGPASISGTLSDLAAEADLETPRGHVQFDGRFDLASERRSYDASLTARGLQLRQWLRGGPDSDLAVQGSVEGSGTDPATLRASFDLEVLPSTVEGARVDSSLLRFTVEQGLARVDTFAIRSDLGVLRGRGGFGLASDRRAALLLSLEAPELNRLNRWIVGRGDPAAADGGMPPLFDGGDGEDGDGAEEGVAPPDTLSGSLVARGAAFGNTEDFGVGGSLTAREVSWGASTADSVRVVLDATDARSLDSLVLSGDARGLGHAGHPADSVVFRAQRTGARAGNIDVRAHRPGASVSADAAAEWSESRRAVDLRALDVRMGDQRLRLADTARISRGDAGLSVDGILLEGGDGARIRLDGSLPRRGEADLELALEDIGLGNVRTLAAIGPDVSGRLQGRLSVRGTAASPRMEASADVDRPGVASHRYEALEGEARYADRRLELETELTGEAGRLARVAGSVRSDLALEERDRRLLDDPLDLRVTGDSLPLDLVLAPVGSVRDVSGHARLDTRVTGSPETPSLDGSGELRAAGLQVVPLDVRVRDVRGRMTFSGTEVRVDSLTLASGSEGRGEVTGSVDVASPTNPTFDLSLRTRRLRVADRRRASMLADGRGRLGGTYRRPTVEGEFRLSDGSVRVEDFLRQDETVDLTDPELLALVDTASLAERRLLARVQNPFLQNLRADLTLQIGPDLWLRARNLDVELAGEVDLRMDRAQADVTVFGDVRLVRGNYRWSAAGEIIGRQLRISEGRIEFVGTPGMDPNLDITATHRVRSQLGTITVSVNITGTMAEPQLAITSEPPLSESDRMCVLLINTPCSAGGARGQLVAETVLGRVGTELSSVLSGGGGPDYVTVQSAAGGRGQRQAGVGDEETDEGDLLGDKEVEIGWYLSPEVFLTLTQPFGRRTPAFTLDWRFSEDWTMEFRSEHLFDPDLSRSASSNLDEQRLWGLFLFREWSF